MNRGSRSAFRSLSLAIMHGFVRDKASVFFALIFPLMFLVLFGGIFSDQDQSKIEMIQVGEVSSSTTCRPTPRRPSTRPSRSPGSDDLAAALEEVRKGDADVAVESRATSSSPTTRRPTRSRPRSPRARCARSSTAPTSRRSGAAADVHPRRPSGSRTTRSRRSSSSRPACSAGRSR